MKNKDWIKLGAIKKSDAGKQYIALGNPKAKNPKYQFNVEIKVTDGSGNLLAQALNPNFTVNNPRKRTGITEEQLAMIPEYILAELSLPPAKE